MARQRELSPERKAFLNSLLEHYQPNDAQDCSGNVKRPAKSLYLAMVDITKKWTGTAWAWGQTLDQLYIYFGDCIQPEDII